MVSDKIKALLSMKGKKYNELATLFGISPQAMRNKFVRGSFSADELIMIADFLNCQLAFEVDNEQKFFNLLKISANQINQPIQATAQQLLIQQINPDSKPFECGGGFYYIL